MLVSWCPTLACCMLIKISKGALWRGLCWSHETFWKDIIIIEGFSVI
jgi:hypothetical protein